MNINEIGQEIRGNIEHLKKYQKQQAGLDGELKQINSQLKEFGIKENAKEEEVNKFLENMETKTNELVSSLDDVLDEIQVLLNEIEKE